MPHFKLLLFHSAFSSLTEEEEIQESLKLTGTLRTHELKPETKRFCHILGRTKEKPVFLSTLSPVTVTVGEPVVFTVRVSSFPEPTIHWFHDGQRIASSSEYCFIHELDKYSLVINTAQKEYEGEYFCSASNQFGRSTCSSHLLVQLKEPGPEVDLSPPEKPPKFTKAIESFEVAEGGQCFFRYRVTGKPLPDIQWLKGGFHIQPNEFCVIINHSDGSGFINMKNAKLEHSGVYTCKAFNQNGEDCCTAELLVVTHRTCEEDASVQKVEHVMTALGQVGAESKFCLDRAQSRQMIYTISTGDPQIIQSEELVALREVDIFAATSKREQCTHQTAVLQSHELQERVSFPPAHPPKVSAIPTEHLQTEMFLPSVQKQNVIEQRSAHIISPEVLKPEFTLERLSELTLATSEEALPLMTVKDETLTTYYLQHIQVLPAQLASGQQEGSVGCILGKMLGSTNGAQDERGFRGTKDFKVLCLAQSATQLLLKAYSEPLLASESANRSVIGREQLVVMVAPVSESKLALNKENGFEIQRQKHESVRPCRHRVNQSAITAKEIYKVQTEQTEEITLSGTPVSLKLQHEGKLFVTLQIISDQNVLQSEGQLSSKKLFMEQAKVRKNLLLLHLGTQEEQKTIVYETTLELSAETEETSCQAIKEQQQSKHLQSVHSSPVLLMEGKLIDTQSDEQNAFRKQEKMLSCIAPTEMRQEITADFYKNVNASMEEVKPQCLVESRLSSMLPVSLQLLLLPKETAVVTNLGEQQALLEKEDYQIIMHSLNITDTQILEEVHCTNLQNEEKFNAEVRTEPNISKNSVFIRDNAVATESCRILKEAEPDFALHIKEGQSIHQSVLMEEKQVMFGDQVRVFYDPESYIVSMNNQSKEAMSVHESQDSQTLRKQLNLVIDLPASFSLSIQHHILDALHSALASDQLTLLSDAVQRLESVEIQEVKALREPTPFSCVPLDIVLFFQGDCHQTADLKSELQLALHAMVFKEKQIFTPEQENIFQIEILQKAQFICAPSTKKLPSLVGTVLVMENVVEFPSAVPHFAEVKTEDLTSFYNAIVQNNIEINKSTKESWKTESSKRHWTAAESWSPGERHMDGSTCRETREECISEVLMVSQSTASATDSPLVVNFLKDICAEENSKTVFTATIKKANRVLWYFEGQLVKSGSEFMCSKHHDTYTLAINKVAKDKHEGQYVCEAVNEVGRTTTSSRLTVISRGLMMVASLISTTNFTPW